MAADQENGAGCLVEREYGQAFTFVGRVRIEAARHIRESQLGQRLALGRARAEEHARAGHGNTADQANAALIQDLKERGLLDDTLVIWAGEFGRTVYSQGKLTADDYGRDHHPRAFTVWMAGGGVKAGATVGATDDFSYNITEDPVHLHDMNATILRCLGIDHLRLTYKFQGRYFRLTDTGGKVVKKALNFDPAGPAEPSAA